MSTGWQLKYELIFNPIGEIIRFDTSIFFKWLLKNHHLVNSCWISWISYWKFLTSTSTMTRNCWWGFFRHSILRHTESTWMWTQRFLEIFGKGGPGVTCERFCWALSTSVASIWGPFSAKRCYEWYSYMIVHIYIHIICIYTALYSNW